jgi:hypothetical protein
VNSSAAGKNFFVNNKETNWYEFNNNCLIFIKNGLKSMTLAENKRSEV